MHNLPSWTIDILSVMLWVVPALLVLAAACLWITARDAKQTFDVDDDQPSGRRFGYINAEGEAILLPKNEAKRPPVNR